MFSICTLAAVSWCSNSTSIELDGSAAIIQGTDAPFEALSEEIRSVDIPVQHPAPNSWYTS